MPSDYFEKPEQQDYRHKTLICRSKNKAGERCSLYMDHYGKHKSNHLKSEWTDEEAGEQ